MENPWRSRLGQSNDLSMGGRFVRIILSRTRRFDNRSQSKIM
jgi:hypothetical protein